MSTTAGRQLVELQEKIAASLYLKPATLDELMEREFLEYIADFMVDRFLHRLEGKGWLFVDKAGRYHTYKHVARKELAEYELV